jgi:hypothetical protein
LVFDGDRITALVLRHEIDAEVAGGLLPFRSRERQTEGIVENIYVVPEPGREVRGFMLPNLP